MNKQKGFTLIELVIVVVLIGLLSVTAIPKFIDLTDQAKQANVEGMAGGFATAVSLARAQWEAEARPKNTNNLNSVVYDGTTLILTTEDTTANIRGGYVTGLTTGGALGGGFTAINCTEIWENILQQPPRVTSTISTLNNDNSIDYFVSKSGNGVSTQCHYYLRNTLTIDNNGVVQDPGVSTTVGNNFTYQPANSSVIVYINNS